MAKNVPLALVVAGMLAAMALLLGAMALYQDRIANDDDDDDGDTETEVEVEEATLLYEDEIVRIEYLGNDMYRFTALQPEDFAMWALRIDRDTHDESNDGVWTYELAGETGFYDLCYVNVDESGTYYFVDTDTITAGPCIP